MSESYITAEGTQVYDWELEDIFAGYIDTTEEPVEILGIMYQPGHLLKHADPIAFQCALNDWLDDMLTNGGWSVE